MIAKFSCLSVSLLSLFINGSVLLVIDRPIARSMTDNSPPLISIASDQFPDRIIKTSKLQGYLDGFVAGDYHYAIIKSQNGKKYQFLVKGNEDCFLDKNRKVKLWVEYQKVEHYFPEASSYQPVIIIKSIRTPKTTWKQWQRSLTPAESAECRSVPWLYQNQ